MIIGVDAANLAADNDWEKVGNFWLTHNFLRELSRIDKNNLYRLYSFSRIPNEIFNQYSSNFTNYIIGPKKFWMQGRVSLELLINAPDVFLGFNQSLPLIANTKKILFVLDLAFEKFPQNYPKNYRKLAWQTKSAIAKSDKIIAISYSTKNDLVDIYKVDSGKIEVVYPFVENIFRPFSRKKISEFLNRYGVKKEYFLYVGSLKKSKNVDNIKKAYSLLSSSEKAKVELIVSLERFGFLSRETLPLLYNGALALVSPSQYEGFGLPHLEAISCGIPVICAKNGSQEEVVKKAGIYVKENNPVEIARAMKMVLNRRGNYNFLKKQAVIQKENFSGEKSVSNLLSIIDTFKK